MPELQCPNHSTNFLSPNGFVLQIERLPLVSFFSHMVQLPTVSLPNLEQSTPLSKAKLPGDVMDFQPLQITFMVDEEMTNYMEIYSWMTGLTFPEDYNQYISENAKRAFKGSSELAKNYSDGKLFILNSHNNVIRTFNFIDCFPISLEGLSFDSKATDVQYVQCSMTLEYSYFNID